MKKSLKPYALVGPEGADGVVRAWTTWRLPFKDRQDSSQKEFCADLRDRLKRVKSAMNYVLEGAYVSDVKSRCDAENVLFYNVGLAAFAHLATSGLRFERAFASPAQTPVELTARAEHQHEYRLAPKSSGFKKWRVVDVIAQWTEADCTGFRKVRKPDQIWLALKSSEVRTRDGFRCHDREFAVKAVLKTGIRSQANAARVIKEVLDGIVAAFQAHNGENIAHTGQLLAARVQADVEVVCRHLTDASRAVLGTSPLVYARGEGLGWSPCDDRCVAAELLLETTSDERWVLQGEICAVVPIYPDLS